MARGELLRKLFSSYSGHDENSFRNTALEIISEEQQKQNHALAKDLMKILDTRRIVKEPKTVTFNYSQPIPTDKDRDAPLVEIRQPAKRLSDAVLGEHTQAQVFRILEEFRKTELLRVHGLKAKSKLLFCGPPGCGKTLTAEIIASELHLPILYTRFDAIISSYLGETSSNLRQLFDYARSSTWVVILDEFDAIGKSRNDPTDHGELKRVVNSFLQLLDSFDGNSLIIATTNHEGLLDDALWRRFDEVVVFNRPSTSEVRLVIEKKLKNFPHNKSDISYMAKQLVGLSHSDIEWFCFDAIKSAILQGEDSVSQSIIDEVMIRLKNRLRTKATSKPPSRKNR